jgi:hypothetical protein
MAKKSNEPTGVLKYKSCWHAPGYRSLGVVMVDPDTGKEFQLSVGPKDLQRLINDCADAAKQISDIRRLTGKNIRRRSIGRR